MQKTKDVILYNHLIKVKELRVIFENNNLGIMKIDEARALAEEHNLDLVLMVLEPPVAKICDLGKYKYEMLKLKKAQRQNNKPIVVKQVQLGPKISQHDLMTKLEHAREFLSENDKVSFRIKLRYKETQNAEFVKKTIEFLKDVITNKLECKIINEVKQEKNNITAQVGPSTKNSSSLKTPIIE